MKSLADELPPDIAKQVSAEWRKNEADYWSIRPQLIGQYAGMWVGFSDGKVVAAGKRPVMVAHAAKEAAEHPFVTCVGHEGESFRMRRVEFPYDTTYPGEPLPVIRAEFRKRCGTSGVVFDQVIADTGADTTALPFADCQQLQLDWTQGSPSTMTGVGGSQVNTLSFTVWVYLDGNEYPCQLHVDPTGRERIMGRDVFNSIELLFRGPSAEVVVNP